MNTRLAVGLVCSGIGLVLYVVGISTTSWASNTVLLDPEINHEGLPRDAEIETGLWQVCATVLVNFNIVKGCTWHDMSRLPAADHACRFFALVGALLLIPGVALGMYAARQGFTDKVYMKKTVGGLIIAAGACGLLTAAIFTGFVQVHTIGPVPYGYSFYLTWVQSLFTFGGGAVFLTA